MVKVIGPALSLGASKSLGNLLTFQKRRGGTAVYLKNKPGGREPFTPSYKQRDQRAIIGLLTAQWQSFTQAVKDQWNEDAKTAGEVGSGYHYWLKKAQTNLLFYHGLAGYWSFNGPVGPTVPDLSGNGNTGTLNPSYPANCPVRVDSINPKFGQALKFDGIDDFVYCGAGASLDIRDQLTIEAIVKFVSWGGSGYPDVVEKTPSYTLGFRVTDQRFASQIWIAGVDGRMWGPPDLELNKWYYFLLTYDKDAGANNAKEIQDKVVKVQDTRVGQIDSNPAAVLTIGRNGDMVIDEVRIYKRVLSILEIQKHYTMFQRSEHGG